MSGEVSVECVLWRFSNKKSTGNNACKCVASYGGNTVWSMIDEDWCSQLASWHRWRLTQPGWQCLMLRQCIRGSTMSRPGLELELPLELGLELPLGLRVMTTPETKETMRLSHHDLHQHKSSCACVWRVLLPFSLMFPRFPWLRFRRTTQHREDIQRRLGGRGDAVGVDAVPCVRYDS